MRRSLLAASFCLLAAAAQAQRPQDWGPTSSFSAAAKLDPPVPASLAGNGSYTPCVPSSFARAFDVFAATAAAATLQIQRYADAACVYPVGAAYPATPQALTAGGGCPGSTRCGDVALNDGMPHLAFKITLTDTSGSTNAITAVSLTQGAE